MFSGRAGHPQWSQGRKAALSQHPLPNIVTLNITEADVFWHIDWTHPQTTPSGLAIDPAANPTAVQCYDDNFTQLVNLLRPRLVDKQQVFTHNPWGEYGNPEHVQVFRAVTVLQAELGFAIWVSGYFSNKSARLMLQSIDAIGAASITVETNRSMAERVKALYERHDCWTWYDDYAWPAHETFYQVRRNETGLQAGASLNLHYVHIDERTPARNDTPSAGRKLRRAARRAARFLRHPGGNGG